jgi:VIT1/CCC1 family predicted Fe2+/Mn2+ transporter
MRKFFQPDFKKEILALQLNEITEHHIYLNLSRSEKDPQKRSILEKIAAAEKKHYEYLRKKTGIDLNPKKLKVWLYSLLAALLGYHFALKHMEQGEAKSQQLYRELLRVDPAFMDILRDEEEHELALLELIDEERLSYIGSMVLGLNDGVVELLGTVAGLTFALKSSKLVGLSALIVGVAACLSMSSSEYLSASTEKDKNPLTAAFYTAVSYFLAVISIVIPFFLFASVYFALIVSVALVFILIAFFSYYLSTVQRASFRKRFLKMSVVVISVSTISFAVGYLLRLTLGIEI